MNFTNRKQARSFYADILHDAEKEGSVLQVMNTLGRRDLFFLLTRLLHRKDVDNDWLFDRCVDVQRRPNGMLDLWAREHYKSTIITYGKTIQDVVDSHSKDSFYWKKEVVVGIFSHTRPIAKAFLSQIMQEFEQNELLKQVYPDILYENPRREAPKWSLDSGLVVKRKSNPKEATIEAHGLVDGQPTSKHFDIKVYDDVVTRESVTTPEQIQKTTEAWELSDNLGSKDGVERYIGTRYHFNDTWRVIMEREAATPRIHAATNNGLPSGEAVFLDKASLIDKRRKQGPYTFACQMLQNPKAEDAMGFVEPWLMFYEAYPFQRGEKQWPTGWNYYLLCDPAGEKKKENDYTVITVIALGPDNNYYLVDMIRDRMNLVERTAAMFMFHRKYNITATGYEKYGKDSDIEHIVYEMDHRNYRFDIIALGGKMPKNDRIRRLVPLFAARRFFLPYRLMYVDYEEKNRDLIQEFKDDEFLAFPVSVHDDMLDNMARITDPDLGAEFPDEESLKEDIMKAAVVDYELYNPSQPHYQQPMRAQTEYDLVS